MTSFMMCQPIIKSSNSTMNDYEYLFKFIMIGDSNVGKSCLLLRFIEGRFKNQHEPTLGVQFGSKLVNIRERKIKLQLWDTAGQESFKCITRAYYKGSIAALLVFDLSSQSSFTSIKHWLYEVRANSHQKLRLALIGNKSDLQSDREVSDQTIRKFMKEFKIDKYYQTSALKGVNMDAPFIEMGDNILSAIENKQIDPEVEVSIGIKLNSKKSKSMYKIPINPQPLKSKERSFCTC